ncbi:hypothetical protein ABEW90_04995 [Bacillus subtilis]|nr:hypothetical protein [Bacillus subtilis]
MAIKSDLVDKVEAETELANMVENQDVFCIISC